MTPTRGDTAQPRLIRLGIVDDHRLVLDGISSHLHMSHPDIRVVAAETTWVGLLAHPEFPVDVVLLDLSLGDGIPIATKVQALAPTGVAIVVMSRHSDAITVQSALHAGALSFVPKSDDTVELVTAIRAAAAGRRHRPRSVAHATIDAIAPSTPGLGARELRALMLYSTGRTVKDVAALMATTEETVKSYLKRARRKYLRAGVDLGTRVLLRRHAIREGWLSPE
ncbi:LuxR family two component transcriptional regulator [Homoserinimonas aerilata]|uniref:LuxR family two component transcriptional regulator n=1 Tax=Homoserinimonas aerilata TaxID=1162970 RepID=A0A542YKC3_9MICO|nr:response regulator transcription factor [Homoserinimonas aerilata]TQL48553.1 LuxR family two component transcriptional regulator [Homoserinimonas aerilata]